MPPHNLTLTLIGASLLWGGLVRLQTRVPRALPMAVQVWRMAVTQIATAAAALGWMFAEWIVKGKPSVLGIASGAVAGLVAITTGIGALSDRRPARDHRHRRWRHLLLSGDLR